MADRPLLFFPEPIGLERGNPARGAGNIRHPSRERQGERLGPRFAALQDAFDAERPRVGLDASGSVPEQVVVMETIGGVQDFQRAVARTQLEWLGEVDLEDVPPDEDFLDQDHPEAELPRRLYLTIANQQAIKELLSLWEKWLEGGKEALPRNFKKWGDLLSCLREVRLWGVEDRLRETQILEDWRERVARGEDLIRCEVQLWARGTAVQRLAAKRNVEQLLASEQGRLLAECSIEQIAYHAVLAELPIAAVSSILAERASELVRAEAIMLFRPCVQTCARAEPKEDGRRPAQRERGKPSGAPVVALLDGLPIENHELLQGRLNVDDPDGWSNDYLAVHREHGTAMASLIVHGDLGDDLPALSTPLYVRPVTRPGQQRWEEIPPDRLAVDAVHEAVLRVLKEAPTVRIVNLSLGDRWHPFQGFLSPWARLLDWLAAEHGLLFVVSAGNDQARHLQLDATPQQVQGMTPEQLQAATLSALVKEARHRTILAPAEALNVLTVGASHADAADVEPRSDLRELVGRGDVPAPYGCVGLGYRRAIKPDVLAPGGRAWFRESIGNSQSARFEQVWGQRLCAGLEHACPGGPGSPGLTGRSSGTSGAAAICSRSLAFALDALQPLFDDRVRERMLPGHEALLLRALAVHTAEWGGLQALLEPLVAKYVVATRVREHVARFLGYGALRAERMLGCTQQRATMLGFGSLEEDAAHQFAVPIPAAMGPHLGLKRFTATLTWFSPINPRHRDYRRAALWFDLPQLTQETLALRVKRTQADWQAVRRGTIQHEVLEGERASVVGDRSTIQVRVNCRALAGHLTEPVPYALVCSLEVDDGVPIAVYDEVRQRLQVRVPASGPGSIG